MPETRVALDTSVLRRDPRLKGGGFEALARFAQAGYVEILIPEVVAKEFLSLPSDKANTLTNVKKALSELRRATPEEFTSAIESFEQSVDEEFEKIEAGAETSFNEWVKRAKAKIVSCGNDHGARVLSKYFDGAPPFKTRKSRTDFPDAFITEILKDLAVNEPLLAVVGDKRMAEALRDVPNVVAFHDLKALLESDEFADLRTEVETENVSDVLSYVRSNANVFDQAIDVGVADLLAATTVRYHDRSWDEKEPAEHLYIEDISGIRKWTLDIDGADYLGEGVISFVFGASVEVRLETPSDRSHYYYDDEYTPRTLDAVLEVTGVCSLIINQGDLQDPAAGSHVADVIERARLDVDELDSVTIKETEDDRW